MVAAVRLSMVRTPPAPWPDPLPHRPLSTTTHPSLPLPPHAPAAFLTMAGEIKNRMALVPQAEDSAKGAVNVGKGTTVKSGGGGGGCC